MPTKQATFELVCEHLIRQGSQSKHAVFGCAYRGQDGLRCAIGALLPDEAYSFELEGQSAQRGTVADILTKLDHDLQLCRELQLIHDRVPVEHWPKAMEKVAFRHSLDLPASLQEKLQGEIQVIDNLQSDGLLEADNLATTDLNDSAAMSSPVPDLKNLFGTESSPEEDIQVVSSLPNISQAIQQAQNNEIVDDADQINLQAFEDPDEAVDAIELDDDEDMLPLK